MVFIEDCFERAARAQAEALRLPSLKIYSYPQPKPGEPVAPKAAKAADELPKLLEPAGPADISSQ